MSEKLRQSIIGLIWPGPIAGPLPINLFRITSPALVFYTNPLIATLIMSLITAIFSIFYLGLLELTAGRHYVENLLQRLPKSLRKGVEEKGPFALFLTSLVVGTFAYAILLRLLRYSQTKSEILLIAASFATASIWTGVFWGSVVEILRRAVGFAF